MLSNNYKTALVTGASSGIGESVVRLLCKKGYKVSALARRGSKLQRLSKETGCKILVKLRQFDKNDKSRIVIREDDYKWLPGICQGLTVMPLHSYQSEHSALVKWEPHTKFSNHSHWGGEEIYILRGTLFDEFGVYKKGTWIRSPHMSSHNPYTTNDGALIFVKTGHIHE